MPIKFYNIDTRHFLQTELFWSRQPSVKILRFLSFFNFLSKCLVLDCRAAESIERSELWRVLIIYRVGNFDIHAEQKISFINEMKGYKIWPIPKGRAQKIFQTLAPNFFKGLYKSWLWLDSSDDFLSLPFSFGVWIRTVNLRISGWPTASRPLS